MTPQQPRNLMHLVMLVLALLVGCLGVWLFMAGYCTITGTAVTPVAWVVASRPGASPVGRPDPDAPDTSQSA